MASKFLDYTGLTHLVEKLKTLIGTKSTVSVTQTLKTGTKSATITVDGTDTDLYAPTPVTYTLTQDATDGHKITFTPSSGTATTITIPDEDTTYSTATTAANGLMSSSDKSKLNGIATGAEVNVQADWEETTTSSDAYIKNKPTIPTVNDSTLTIQKNGTQVATFTANSASDVTANITVPTKVSELTNDSGFKTTDENVKQTLSTANNDYCVLLAYNTSTATATEGARKVAAIKANPSTGTITATAFSGTASKATADASGNVITATYATKSEVSSIPKFAIEVVDALPTEGISTTTVYLLKASETETGNLYTEYIYVNSAWEKLGTQTLDISAISNDDIDKLF